MNLNVICLALVHVPLLFVLMVYFQPRAISSEYDICSAISDQHEQKLTVVVVVVVVDVGADWNVVLDVVSDADVCCLADLQ